MFPYLCIDLTLQDTSRGQIACGQDWSTVVGNVLQLWQSFLVDLLQAPKEFFSSLAVPLPHLWVLDAANAEYLMKKSLG